MWDTLTLADRGQINQTEWYLLTNIFSTLQARKNTRNLTWNNRDRIYIPGMANTFQIILECKNLAF